MVKNVSKNRLVTAWTSVITTTALTLVEALRVTIRYMAGEHTRVCPHCQGKTSISSQFCEKCGHDLRAVTYQNYGKVEVPEPEPEEFEEPPKTTLPSKNYCSTCGGPLGGSEQYCPTCGMPLGK